MAIELVTGKAGVPHVDSEDVGAFNAYSLGSGAYIMSGCEVMAKSANIVSISAGEILWEGRHIRVKGSGESLAVDNGQTGYNRRDLITLNYAKDSSGIENVSFKVVKGTPTTGTAADPSVKVGSILAGDTSAVIPFARITLSGLSVATPTVLLGSLPSLSSLRDSVSPKASEYWTVLNFGGVRIAWIIVGTNSGPVVPGSNMIARKLPFTPKANNAVNVLASLIGTGAANVDNFTDVDLLPSVNGNTLTVNAYNSGQHTVVNASISILVLERLEY